MVEKNSRSLPKRAHEFVAFAVLAAETDWNELADSQSSQIVDNRSRRAGLTAHVDDVVDLPAGFNRGFVARRINLEIAIETNITQYCDAEFGISRCDFLKALFVHVAEERCSS